MNRDTRIATTVALAVMMALSPAAWAGAKGGSGVTISWNGDNGTAAGTMGTVRHTADALQYIGCTVAGNTTSQWVTCSARNSSNVTVTCTSWEPEIIQAAHALTSDAHISFNWNESGACTALSVRADSRYRPKAP